MGEISGTLPITCSYPGVTSGEAGRVPIPGHRGEFLGGVIGDLSGDRGRIGGVPGSPLLPTPTAALVFLGQPASSTLGLVRSLSPDSSSSLRPEGEAGQPLVCPSGRRTTRSSWKTEERGHLLRVTLGDGGGSGGGGRDRARGSRGGLEGEPGHVEGRLVGHGRGGWIGCHIQSGLRSLAATRSTVPGVKDRVSAVFRRSPGIGCDGRRR